MCCWRHSVTGIMPCSNVAHTAGHYVERAQHRAAILCVDDTYSSMSCTANIVQNGQPVSGSSCVHHAGYHALHEDFVTTGITHHSRHNMSLISAQCYLHVYARVTPIVDSSAEQHYPERKYHRVSDGRHATMKKHEYFNTSKHNTYQSRQKCWVNVHNNSTGIYQAWHSTCVLKHGARFNNTLLRLTDDCLLQ